MNEMKKKSSRTSDFSYSDQNYLTHKPIISALLGLAVPIMASSFFSTAYNITDMMWIGRLGSSAVAGVGTGGMFLWLASGLAVMPRMGGQVLTAQYIGREKYVMAMRYAKAALQMAALLGIGLGLSFFLFSDFLIGLFRIDDTQTVRDAVIYLKITGGCVFFLFLNQVLTGTFTAQGDSRTPLISNTIGLALNMILDPILILGWKGIPAMGAVGAASATVAAEAVSFMVFWIVGWRNGRLPVGIKMADRRAVIEERERNSRTLLRDRRLWKEIIQIGTPSSLRSMLYCMYSMILTRFVTGFGSEAIAVMRLGGQIESVTWNAADGFASAMNSFTGQNYGAGKIDRIRKGYRFSFWAVAGWGSLITAIFLLFPGPIAKLFFFEETAIAICVRYLIIVGLCEPFMAIEILSEGTINGFGDTLISSLISILLTGARIPLAYLLMRMGLGLDSILLALTSTSIAKGFIMYFAVRWVLKKHQREITHPIHP